MQQSGTTEPVVKWPGGKRSLLKHILRSFPRAWNTYIEPFFGGGAVFFALRPKQAILGDVNEDLMNFYHEITREPDEVIRRTRLLTNSSEEYYKVRASRPASCLEKAVRFMYLNRTCFNGLYRTNKRGEFNVPFAGNGRPLASDDEGIKRSAELLKTTRMLCDDFERTCSLAKVGDLVYFDPPYITGHENNGFVKYNASLFTWTDQLRLRDLMLSLSRKNVLVIMTNAAHHSIENLYRGFHVGLLNRASVLSAKRAGRHRVNELLIRNF